MKKELILMRGFPGSGKSTRALELGGIICSSDLHMLDGMGNYFFDRSRLSETHYLCEKDCVEAMRGDAPRIIIDNCNLVKSFYLIYFLLALEYGYEVIFEDVGVGLSAEELYVRCRHGCPLEKIQELMSRAEFPSAAEINSSFDKRVSLRYKLGRIFKSGTGFAGRIVEFEDEGGIDLSVEWDSWGDLNSIERAELIKSAYEVSFGSLTAIRLRYVEGVDRG